MEKSNFNFKIKFVSIFSILLVLLVAFLSMGDYKVFAQSENEEVITELRTKILSKNQEIEKINKEITKYRTELVEISEEANTLENAVKSLDLTHNKLLKDIDLTENKIDSTELNLSKLEIEIGKSQNKIDNATKSLAETLKLLNDSGDSSIIEVMLKYEDLSSFWAEVDSLEEFQVGIKQNLESLKIAKDILEGKRKENESEKEELEDLKLDLGSQQEIVEDTKEQKNVLLKKTKNTESEYQRILQENIKKKEALEKEIFQFESQLQIYIDPSKLPSPAAGILSWPLDNIKVTQLFGKTVDSQRLYTSGTHNGVDFGVPMGSKVKAADAGVVSHIGNTDEVPGCLSFGRWVLIKHNNGISTLYSHLSSTQVSVGQAVERGKHIAFSGGAPGTSGAGYSTGPHLHFGVYATEGLRPQSYQSSTPCNGAYMPLADQKAYLDPMEYLPGV